MLNAFKGPITTTHISVDIWGCALEAKVNGSIPSHSSVEFYRVIEMGENSILGLCELEEVKTSEINKEAGSTEAFPGIEQWRHSYFATTPITPI